MQQDLLETLQNFGGQAIEAAQRSTTQLTTDAIEQISTTTAIIYPTAENLTLLIGQTVEPIAQNSAVQLVTRVPGLDWLLLWLGEVDHAKAKADIEQLRRDYPLQSDTEIAGHAIQQMALEAAKVGFLTNIIPPIALALVAVDLVALTKIQAELAYRLAAAYHLDLDAPERRGEVIAIYALFASSSPLQAGLSLAELIPGLGAIIGASSNGVLVYVMGAIAQSFYEYKRKRLTPANV
jgi:uncharacterized protein (DUF697 family)